MVVLKKIRASTLMETLVATVLIVIVFLLASMILNTLFNNSIKNKTHDIETYLNELEYRYMNHKVELPFYGEFEKWQITIDRFVDKNQHYVEIEANNKELNKTITKQKFETNP
ncbi:hypothetical protein [Xanthomarina gelatinilytica]|uniref:hypothetical protein n=1 Tax=Xanthomarina gelatinilytica TaxID=1137281 RepID=UPI003AA8E1E6